MEKRFIYVGTFDCDTFLESYGIHAFEMDCQTGALTKIEIQNPGYNPDYLVTDTDKKFLFASNDRQTRADVCAYQISSTGKLFLVSKLQLPGAGMASLEISRDGRFLVAPYYETSAVGSCSVNGNGKLLKVVQQISLQGHGITERQTKAHPHQVLFDREGKHVLVPDLGSDRVWSFSYDENSGRLTLGSSLAFIPGSGPRHIAFHPNNRWAYVITELKNTIHCCQFNSKTGELTEVQCVELLPEDFMGECIAAEIDCSPDGDYLFATTRGYYTSEGYDRIFTLKINPDDGTVNIVRDGPTWGVCPRMFKFTPDGKFLLIANQFSDELIVLQYDATSGRIGEICARENVPYAGAICIVDTQGENPV